MTVLIVNINQDFFTELLPKVKFQPSIKNTCTFQIGEKKFKELLLTRDALHPIHQSASATRRVT